MELKILFDDIADAIREKSGDNTPISASAFPVAISALPEVSTDSQKTYSGKSGLKELLSDIATSIKSKNGSTDLLSPTDFSSSILALSFGGPMTTETFTESATWIVPAGVTSVSVVCIGGGGGGGGRGGAGGTGSPKYPGGYGYGGSAGVLKTEMVSVTEGSEIAITVGAGGRQGAVATYSVTGSGSTAQYRGRNGGPGTTGGESSFGDLLTAAGGAGGKGGTGATPSGPGGPTTVQSGADGYEEYNNAGAGGGSGKAGSAGLVVVSYKG